MNARIWKAALVFAGVFLAAGMASASLLGSFGVISGEADVEPAMEIVEVKSNTNVSGNDGEYILFENNFGSLDPRDWKVEQNGTSIDEEFEEIDSSEITVDKFALADADGEFSNYGDIQIYELSSVLSGIPANDDEVLFLKYIDPETVIQEVDYDECAEVGKAYSVEDDDCQDASIEVNS